MKNEKCWNLAQCVPLRGRQGCYIILGFGETSENGDHQSITYCHLWVGPSFSAFAFTCFPLSVLRQAPPLCTKDLSTPVPCGFCWPSWLAWLLWRLITVLDPTGDLAGHSHFSTVSAESHTTTDYTGGALAHSIQLPWMSHYPVIPGLIWSPVTHSSSKNPSRIGVPGNFREGQLSRPPGPVSHAPAPC